MALSLALTLVGNLVVALFVLICAALILIILLQKGRGGGLSAAFGGGGAGSLLGTKTGDFLTWVTISLVAGFLVLAVLMGKFMRPSGLSPELSPPLSGTTAPFVDETATDDMETVDETIDGAAAGVPEEAALLVEETTQDVVDQAGDAVVPTPEPSN